MTTYYVGSGGNNANAGTSWALRRLTLTSIESLVAAGDTVYVGPGTYRETLTTVISGSAGNLITYIGDEGGTLTDGVGGAVRLTGSDNDQTATRAQGISCGHHYRTFRGFQGDTVTSTVFDNTGHDVIFEQCVATHCAIGFRHSGSGATNTITRRFIAAFCSSTNVSLTHSATVDNSNQLVENGLVFGGANTGLIITRIGGVTARNLLVFGCVNGIRVSASPAAGQVNNVNDCVVFSNSSGLVAVATTDMTEDYNNLFGNATARTNVSAGAHSQAYTPLLEVPLLTLGLLIWKFGALSPASALASMAGSGVATDDLYGLTRAGTSSWGAIEYQAGRRPVNAYRRSRTRGR